MTLAVLIPCKELASGKSRLAPRLDAPARKALCESLLTRTLHVALDLPPPVQVHIVTPDAEAAALSENCKVPVFVDSGIGLNEALEEARRAILRAMSPSALLVLPIDLPLATPENVAAIGAQDADVVIAPDEALRGTNLLLLRGRALHELPFRFGPGSYALHRRAAEERGLTCRIVKDAALAFDIDRPQDLERWAPSLTGEPEAQRL